MTVETLSLAAGALMSLLFGYVPGLETWFDGKDPIVKRLIMLASGLEGEALDKHTLMWAEQVNRSGGAYLTPAILDGRWMVRVSIGAISTERQHVEALWALMRREAEKS